MPDPVSMDPRSNKKVTLLQRPQSELMADSTVRDSIVNLIVRLKTSPGAKTAASRVNLASKITQEHEDFLSKLNELGSNARTTGDAKTIKVVREYKKSFNGFTLKANRSFTGAIQKMPHVISVTEDKKVKANDMISNDIIKAPQVWNQVGATGEGIVIGIIDTGIDYQHTDLGGGIGPQKKVIGGYDFVNNDSDPMDDHGHGTHVAGIAAAKGTTMKGVAPDAKLVAIKVLGADGWGYDSQILAGIEYALDPDGNPATDDAVDVVNMSLGRTPDENEPMSEAVNNAVAAGVCFVVAAGNSYDYFRVGTPGIARDAITVGATDQWDFTANFSSKGPLPDSFLLKPDIAAPGYQVNSTYMGGGYKVMDGTSMASPHVAGVAALLLDKHPDWTPEDLKAAMMSTARMTGFNRFLEIGSGIVDAHKAITTDIIMSPGSISYGRPKTNDPMWTRHDVLKFTNKGQSSQQIVLTLDGLDEEAAVDVHFTPSQFTLAAGATMEVGVDVFVNMASFANRNIPNGYFGTIVATAGTKQLKTLLSLFNPAITTLEFPAKMSSYVIVGGVNVNYWQPVNPKTPRFEMVLPTGKYDFICWFPGDSLAIVEDFEVTTQSKSVVFDSRTVTNRIEFKPLDASGNAIPLINPGSTVMLGPTTITMWFGPMQVFHFSDFKKYKFFTRLFSIPANPEKLYEIALSTGNEISESRIISNDPNDFEQMKITNFAVPGSTQDFHFHIKASGFTTWNSVPLRIPNPANVQLFEDPTDETLSFYRFLPPAGTAGFTWETTMRQLHPVRGIDFVSFWENPVMTAGFGPFDYHLGRSLVNFTPILYPTSSNFVLAEQGPRGAYNHVYGERVAGSVNWTLKKNGQQVSTGFFSNPTQDDYWSSNLMEKQIETGQYELSLKWDSYYVGGRFSDVSTVLSFNNTSTMNWDYGPPVIEKFLMKSNNEITNTVLTGKGARVVVKITDPRPTVTTLQMKKLGDQNWTTLVLGDSTLGMKRAVIPTDILPGHYSLKLTGTDVSGNSVVHTLDPAFVVGSQGATVPFTKVSLILPPNYDINAGTTPVFTWSTVENGSYTFQLSKTTSFDGDLVANVDLTVATYTLPAPLEKDITYYWRVKATVGENELPWSKPYSFKAGYLPGPTLVSPANTTIDVKLTPTKFIWSPIPNGEWQTLEVSLNPEFTAYVYGSSKMPGVSKDSVYHLQPGTTYYWRVKARYYTFYHSYNISSEVFSFKTAGLPPNPGNPNPPNPNDPNDPNDPDDPSVITGLEASGVLSAYPNPFGDRTYIRLFAKSGDVARVRLFDNLGRVVRATEQDLVKGENTVVIEAGGESDEGALSTGIYVGVIELGSGERGRVKLVRR